MKPLLLAIALMSPAFFLHAQKLRKLDDGVVVFPQSGPYKALRLQVVSPSIFHITGSATDQISNDTTLMVVAKAEKTDWKLEENEQNVHIASRSLQATVSLQNGDVVFRDANGKLLTTAKANGSLLKEVKLENQNAYALRQVFSSDAGEALFGLGQHQQGLVNLKGEEVVLLQNNTEVAIPFLVSDKNYGLLWDNYSITHFNDGRSYQPLSQLLLSGAQHMNGSLSAVYAKKDAPAQVFASRDEAEISYDYLPDLEKFPKGFSLQDGKVTWEGSVQAKESGLHKFSVRYGGYAKLWLDGKLVLDRWRQCWNPAMAVVPFEMQQGKKYAFKLEWIPDGGESFISCNVMMPAKPINQQQFVFNSEAGKNINYYFVQGSNSDEVISGYRKLTGKAPIVPKWALGFWQSRERYKNQNEIVSTVQEYRRRQIPLDNIVMDWQYWKPDEWGSQQFDPSRFPDAAGMIDSLHRIYNTQFMISVWPKFYKGVDNFNEFQNKGYLLTRNVEDNRKDWLGFVSTFYDAFNPQANDAFWNLLNKNLFSKKIDAWWMDAPEPDIHSNLSIEQRKRLMYPTAIGSAIKYFNGYPLVNAKAIYEGQRKEDPDKRVFILTRSAYGGSQRYAASVWSGDIAARWHDMKDQVAAGVNFSLSGLPYWTMDIGGFSVERRYENPNATDAKEWKEQTTRWFQFGAFLPLFRSHGQFPFREIFNVASEGEPAYSSMIYYDKLRYRMLPYLYSLAGKAWFDDYTIMRGFVMDFPHDKKAIAVNDAYMLGPSLLVAPVFEYEKRNRDVYLPSANGWYEINSGEYFTGGQTVSAAAPYERMPVFVKEGSILPFGLALQYMNEKPADTIHLFVYTGKDASFELYEDDGNSYAYEKGAYSKIPLHYAEADGSITIDDRKGSYPGMLQKRVFTITKISPNHPAGLDFDRNEKAIQYEGKSIKLKL
ncbi:MAG: TIM-barrel domain-containing protein [Flavisolibacter sp.]